MHLGDAAMVQMSESLMPKDAEGVSIQVIDEEEAIVWIVEATQERSRRRFGRDAGSQGRDNSIGSEVAVHDFDFVVIIEWAGGIVDSVDGIGDFVFGDEENRRLNHRYPCHVGRRISHRDSEGGRPRRGHPR